MSDAVNHFYSSIENASSESQNALVELFVYFLTVEAGYEAATSRQVAECFSACDLVVPANVGARLSEGLKAKPPKYIKTGIAYKLQRHTREAVCKKLRGKTVPAKTSATLRSLEDKLPIGANKDFLKEALDCFEIGANRAAVVITWILVMDHLFHYILANRLAEFNVALFNDKGVKLSAILHRDMFNDIKESKFIELCRAAGIISNDIRKILDEKLGTRNSCAHPSGVTVNKSKVVDFIEDLVDNVVLKFPV